MKKIFRNDIISYREMCDIEKVQTLQRGMNFRLNPLYSVVLMSQRANAPYTDQIYSDGETIEYEGHDVSRQGYLHDPKSEDQPAKLPSGKLTQNGLFINSIVNFKNNSSAPEKVKVYEKIMPGIWSLKGIFNLIDYRIVKDANRNVFRFIMKLSIVDSENDKNVSDYKLNHNRIIPSEVKKEVWKRDGGKCVICGATANLHFDHELPFSKGGTSLTSKNVRLLCMKHNLEKSAKIQ